MRPALALIAVAACGTSPDQARPLALERVSPPQFTSHDVFVGARGDVVVLASRVSRDGGATWSPIDARLGTPTRVTIDGPVVGTYAGGLVRWNLDTGAITRLAGTPAFVGERTWRVQPGGRFIGFDPVRNALALEGPSGWITGALPQPSPTEVDPYIFDVASNGAVALAVAGWGVFRSTDGGATWQRLLQPAQAGRVLVALADGRFVLLGGATTYRFDASGAPAGEAPGVAVEDGEAAACTDGAVIARGAISRDAGATWTSLLGGGALALHVVRVTCDESYWVLGYSDTWGYRLLRYDPATQTGVAAGNWELAGEPAWGGAAPPIVRADDGTLFAAGLAWRDGDATWALRELPPRAWAAAGALHGFRGGQHLVSDDAGRTWTARGAIELEDGAEIEALASDGAALLAAAFTATTTDGVDHWRARTWRSTDEGGTWTLAYDGAASRPVGGDEVTGEAHRFVGVAPDGAWIAAGSISRDGGATWEPTDVAGDRSVAYLTPRGDLVMTLTTDDVWRVYGDAGAGDTITTWALEADGSPVGASELRSVAFDVDGYAYVARGAPYVQIWRTVRPVAD